MFTNKFLVVSFCKFIDENRKALLTPFSLFSSDVSMGQFNVTEKSRAEEFQLN